MSSTEEHMRSAIKFLDPENNLVNIGRARSEIRDALQHYAVEKEIVTIRLTDFNKGDKS